MGRNKPPPVDLADRGLHAAQALRDQIRAAHEAMQGLRETLVDNRAAAAEAGKVRAAVAQAQRVLAALTHKVSEVQTQLDAAEVRARGGASRCIKCGLPAGKHEAVDGSNATPKRGSASVCVHCGTWAVFDTAPAPLILRKPTPAEQARLDAQVELKAPIEGCS